MKKFLPRRPRAQGQLVPVSLKSPAKNKKLPGPQPEFDSESAEEAGKRVFFKQESLKQGLNQVIEAQRHFSKINFGLMIRAMAPHTSEDQLKDADKKLKDLEKKKRALDPTFRSHIKIFIDTWTHFRFVLFAFTVFMMLLGWIFGITTTRSLFLLTPQLAGHKVAATLAAFSFVFFTVVFKSISDYLKEDWPKLYLVFNLSLIALFILTAVIAMGSLGFSIPSFNNRITGSGLFQAAAAAAPAAPSAIKAFFMSEQTYRISLILAEVFGSTLVFLSAAQLYDKNVKTQTIREEKAHPRYEAILREIQEAEQYRYELLEIQRQSEEIQALYQSYENVAIDKGVDIFYKTIRRLEVL